MFSAELGDIPAMQVAILAFPRAQVLDVAGPADVFITAGYLLGNPRAYRVSIVSVDEPVVKCLGGVKLVADHTLATHRGRIDTLLVAGGPDVDGLKGDDTVQDWLRRQARSVRRLGAVCTGTFSLAAAGLLEGRRVTTHWRWADRLASQVPSATVEPDHIHIRDGALYTSAGVTAGMDLALAMVEEDHGQEVALAVARELVMFVKRPGGQSQFSAHVVAPVAERSAIRDVQDHVFATLRGDLGVPALAGVARMSERNFARVFREETGVTPAWFVETARIDAARRLAETSAMPLKRLAGEVGYANAEAFRKAFVRRVGVTPSEYRARFTGGHSVPG